VFPDNEVRKGQLTMELKKLRETQEKLTWPSDNSDLPIISWDSCRCSFFRRFIFVVVVDRLFLYISLVQEQSQKRPLVLVSGFIHDVGSFVNEHPGGPHLLIKMIGKDATTAFFGGVYDHSNAAHNVSSLLARIYFNFHSIFMILIIYIIVTRHETRRDSSRRYAPRVGRQNHTA
jgi:stearoyl-CoA desaturase (delta-9 desaturase)